MSKHKRINKDFFKTWTPEMAYVLGFFAADGYITINKRGGHFFSIDIKDKELIWKIKEAIQSEHAISVRKRAGGQYTSYRLQIGSIEMCADLQRLGFNARKTNNLRVPKVPSEYFNHFVRGYFDGDGNVWCGYVHKERRTKLLALRVIFTSCSREFLYMFRRKLEKVDVVNGVISQSKGNYYRLTYSIHNALKLSEFMYNGLSASKLFLKRKKDVFLGYKVAAVAHR